MKKILLIIFLFLSLFGQAQNYMFYGLNQSRILKEPIYLNATPTSILDGGFTTVTLSVNENVTSTLQASILVINKDNNNDTIPLVWNIQTGTNQTVGNLQTVNSGITVPYVMTIDYAATPPDGYYFASPPQEITVSPD